MCEKFLNSQNLLRSIGFGNNRAQLHQLSVAFSPKVIPKPLEAGTDL